MTSNRPVWDDERAQAMIGARVVIGLTRARQDINRYEQMFGAITAADEIKGFEVTLEGSRTGQVYWLPPHTEAFQVASPGTYRLKATQEDVVDPDFLTTWTIE